MKDVILMIINIIITIVSGYFAFDARKSYKKVKNMENYYGLKKSLECLNKVNEKLQFMNEVVNKTVKGFNANNKSNSIVSEINNEISKSKKDLSYEQTKKVNNLISDKLSCFTKGISSTKDQPSLQTEFYNQYKGFKGKLDEYEEYIKKEIEIIEKKNDMV